LEQAALYFDAFVKSDDARDIFGDDEEEENDEAEAGDDAEAEKPTAELSKANAGKRPAWQRFLDVALAAGYMLRTKAEGWKLFCERMNLPPFLMWKMFPGFDRLQRALAQTEKAAFRPDGFLRWLNGIRPAGTPEQTEVPLTVEGVADSTAKLFQARVAWWDGDG
jgi:hypothetical protein